jgi:hypothetical protein
MFISDFDSQKTKLEEQNQPTSAIGRIGSRVATGVSRAVNPAMAGLSLHDMYQSVRDEDYPGAALSAGSALAYGAGARFPAIAAPAFAVGAGLDVANVLRDPEAREEIKQAIKKPFQGPAQTSRGRGRNVLPAQTVTDVTQKDDIDDEMEKLREVSIAPITGAITRAVSRLGKKTADLGKSAGKGSRRSSVLRTAGDSVSGVDIPSSKFLYHVVRTGGTVSDSPYFANREQAETYLKALPDPENYSVQQQSYTAENKETFSASPNLIQSIVDVESGGREDAVSPMGALGRMQVMPATARNPGFGVKPAQDFSSQELERVGQDYFNAMLNRYDGDKRLALIAYNMGPGAADRWLARGANNLELPSETQAYVPNVLNRYQRRTQQITSTPNARPSTIAQTTPIARPRPSTSQSNIQQQNMLSSEPLAYITTGPRLPVLSTTDRLNRNSVPTRTVSRPSTNRSPGTNPAWTPPPGPKMAPVPQPDSLDPIIKQKNRPDSIEQIIKNKNFKKADLDRLLQLFRDNPEMFASMDNNTINLVQSINDLYKDNVAESKKNIKENIQQLADLLYNELEMTYGDLVHLYGHEVVGDAIEEVLLQQGDETEDIPVMAKKVLRILRQRFDQTENKEPENEIDKKDTTDVEDKNAMIQLQADVDKIKNTLGVKESKIYFNVLATSEQDCREKFKLRKDRQGWYLRESANPKIKLDAIRAFQII